MSDTPATQTERVECPAARDPAVRHFIMAAMLLGFGFWCAFDAYVKGKYPYPADGNLNEVVTFWFNHVGGVVLPLAGLIPLALGIRHLRRRLLADGEGIGYVGSQKIAWSAITRLDATDLAGKGILRLSYGAETPLELDSWKLDNFKALVAFIEQHVPAEAIDFEPPVADDASPR